MIPKFFFLLLSIPLWIFADESHIHSSFEAMKREKWVLAISEAQKSNKPELLKIVLSQKYLSKTSDSYFEEMVGFLSKNPTWPGFDEISINAEKKIFSNTDYSSVKKWFDKHPPVTSVGHKFYSYAAIEEYKKSKVKNKEAVIKIAKNGWIRGEFSEKEQESYLKRYHRVLSQEDHAKKVNLLLWQGNIEGAKKLIPLLTQQSKKVFLARIAAMEDVKDSAMLYNKLDEKDKYHSGLLYSYINNQIKQNPDADITKLIMHAPNDLEHSGEWWKLKAFAIRELIKKKSYKQAYIIASKHYSIQKEDKSEALWMSAWLALSFLNAPEYAKKNFEKFYHHATKPAQISRGAYWLAKAHAAHKDKATAYRWMAKAAAFPETFYGQLASEYINKKKFHLNITTKLREKYKAKFQNDEIIKAISLLTQYKKYNLAQNYMKSAIHNSKHPLEVLMITEIAKNNGKMLVDSKTPKTYNIPAGRVEEALVYAIIKQESAFNSSAISYANAQGLMQIRPDTAREIAKSLGVSYSEAKLTSDIDYNINLGTHFLKGLIDKFNGSYILALVAYNAGPYKVKEWTSRYGDPREMRSINDIINWIELIPFAQTREYVQKVLENLQIYRYILQNNIELKIREDLMRFKKET